jgi:uncharacterized membrane protein YeaQ/YmgE (transglycosylase-associated protein family)
MAMTFKTYMAIISIIGIVFGVGWLLAPEQTAIFYGMKESPELEFSHRLYGGALLAWALIGWFAKDFRDMSALRGVLIPCAIGFIGGVAVTVFGTLSGIMNVMGWFAVLAYLFGAIGAVYFLMTGPSVAKS